MNFVKFAGFGEMNAPDSSIENFLNDDKRVAYMKSYLDALVSAIRYLTQLCFVP